MPRSRSSGALSIWSYARNFANPFFVSTLVIAAVSVVFPWSTCPIVPMFRCGLFRTNFSLAMIFPFWARAESSASHALDDGLGHVGGDRRVTRELHRVRGPALGHGTNIRGVSEHGGQRNLGGDGLRGSARLHTGDAATPRREVPHHL